MRGTMLLLAAVIGCGKTSDRAQQLSNCRAINSSGQGLTSCLVLKYDWNADAALPAGWKFQAELDSLKQAIAESTTAILRRGDSLYRDRGRQEDSLNRERVAAAQMAARQRAIEERAARVRRLLAAPDTVLFDANGWWLRRSSMTLTMSLVHPGGCETVVRPTNRAELSAMVDFDADQFRELMNATFRQTGHPLKTTCAHLAPPP